MPINHTARLRLPALLLTALIAGPVHQAHADVLVPVGQRALLTVSVSVVGSVEAPQGNRGELVKWSTRRRFDATVEMEAENPGQMSFSGSAGGDTAAQMGAYNDLAKKAEACGENQACLLQLAMEMSNSPKVKAAKDAPRRYQMWKSARGNARVDATASYEDKWFAVFFASGRETTDCTLTAPMVSPEIASLPDARATWDKINRDTLQASAEAFVIETDGENRTSQLHLAGLGAGAGDLECTRTIGSRPKTTHTSTNGTVIPVGDLSVPLVLKGTAPGTAVIASGAAELDASLPLTHLEAGYAVKATVPLKVTVRWELKAL
ncbi:MAG: hypothetical protein R3F10_11060 [Lysobacteraceae bacterium]